MSSLIYVYGRVTSVLKIQYRSYRDFVELVIWKTSQSTLYTHARACTGSVCACVYMTQYICVTVRWFKFTKPEMCSVITLIDWVGEAYLAVKQIYKFNKYRNGARIEYVIIQQNVKHIIIYWISTSPIKLLIASLTKNLSESLGLVLQIIRTIVC